MNVALTFGMQVALIRALIYLRRHCRNICSSILCMHVFSYLVTPTEAEHTTTDYMQKKYSSMYTYIVKRSSAGLGVLADFGLSLWNKLTLHKQW